MRFAEPVILNLHSTWEESDPRTPLICFLSMGSDPTEQIEALAKKLQLGEFYCPIKLTTFISFSCCMS